MSSLNQVTDSAATRLATRRLLSTASVPYLLVAVVVVAAVVLLGVEIEQHISAIESWIEDLGPWSLVVYILLYVLLTTLLLPESVLSLMAGAMFGMVWGLGVVVVASLLAAALQFALAHRLLQGTIQRTLGARPSLAIIQQAVMRSELKLQLLIRLMPVNPAAVSYVLGAAGVGFRHYMLACVAIIPHLVLEVWAGYTTIHVARLAGGASGSAGIQDLGMVAGLVAAIVALVLIARSARSAFIKVAAQR